MGKKRLEQVTGLSQDERVAQAKDGTRPSINTTSRYRKQRRHQHMQMNPEVFKGVLFHFLDDLNNGRIDATKYLASRTEHKTTLSRLPA